MGATFRFWFFHCNIGNMSQLEAVQQSLFLDALTNEERKVATYQNGSGPTVAAEVTSKTSLEALNLNWSERELPERIRTKHVHRLHPYLGKYIPQLVEIFLRKYFKPGDTVVDPFAGSGTTLVQANELGINSIGFDISAFNVILCRAKTGKYDLPTVRREVLDVLDQTERNRIEPNSWLPMYGKNSASNRNSESSYLNEWFGSEALIDLLTYRSFIEHYPDQDLLKIILSRAARSSRLTTHFDLDFPKKPQTEPYHCYKHSRTCKPTNDAMQFLRRYSLDSLKRIEEFSGLRSDASVEIHHADSREVDVPEIDGVITSPPYVGLIDYHQQHTYAYHLLGLEDRREYEIGPAVKGSSIDAKRQYQLGIAKVFSRLAEKLKPNGRIIVVAGDRANLYPEIADLAGLETESIVQRHVNRRTGRRSGEFYESVFIWRKPR